MATDASRLTRQQQSGQRAELLARRYLERKGMYLVEANHSNRYGELDLIMRDGNVWVCIEVKYRHNTNYGSAIEMVSVAKRRRMEAAFCQFLMDNGHNPNATPLRFDVIGIDGADIRWLQNI